MNFKKNKEVAADYGGRDISLMKTGVRAQVEHHFLAALKSLAVRQTVIPPLWGEVDLWVPQAWVGRFPDATWAEDLVGPWRRARQVGNRELERPSLPDIKAFFL